MIVNQINYDNTATLRWKCVSNENGSKHLRTCFSMILVHQLHFVIFQVCNKPSFTKDTGGSRMLTLYEFHLKGFPFLLCGEQTVRYKVGWPLRSPLHYFWWEARGTWTKTESMQMEKRTGIHNIILLSFQELLLCVFINVCPFKTMTIISSLQGLSEYAGRPALK